jgi:hypothetical protein
MFIKSENLNSQKSTLQPIQHKRRKGEKEETDCFFMFKKLARLLSEAFSRREERTN